MSSLKKKKNIEEKENIIDECQNKRMRREHSPKMNILTNCENTWKNVDCPEFIIDYEDLLTCEQCNLKRKLCDTENVTLMPVLKKKASIAESNNNVLNINCLPEEILTNIFRYLSHNELGRVGRVCKKWHQVTRYSLLWKKVDVFFRWDKGFQSEVVETFSEKLPDCLTHLKLYFEDYYLDDSLKFEEFSVRLGVKCTSLKVLILHDTNFSVSLQSAIDLCSHHLKNLEVLSFRDSAFTDFSITAEYDNFSKIKILDIFNSYGIESYRKISLSEFSNLKEMNLVKTCVNDSWFVDNTSFLYNLEVLNLQQALISSSTFQALQKYALNLMELYLCGADLKDDDFIFKKSFFPQLKTICLRDCLTVTSDGIVSLVCSCQSLQNVYVNRKVAESYAVHSLVVANVCKLEIVKDIFKCLPYTNADYINYG